MNLYLYTGNDPVNYIDPFGLWTFGGLARSWALGAAMGAIGGGAAAGPAGAIGVGLVGGAVGMLRYVVLDQAGVTPGQLYEKYKDAVEMNGMNIPPKDYKKPCH